MNCLSSVSGGAATYLKNILAPLFRLFSSEKSGRLIILAHNRQRDFFPELPDSSFVPLHGERLFGYRRRLWEELNVKRVARAVRADVVFTPYQVCGTTKGFRNVLMLRNMEPFMCSGYNYSLKYRLRNYLLKVDSIRSINRANRVIAVSRFVREFLVSNIRISGSHIRTIYHGRDESFSPTGPIDTDSRYIKTFGLSGGFVLTCGSLLPYRRCEDVINAFEKVHELLGKHIKLAIAGEAHDSRYRSQIYSTISNSKCGDRIVALGHVNKEAMCALFRRCGIVIISSEIEACPNIAIESMSSGAITVASDRPPLSEMFAGSAYHYESRNIESLGSAVLRAWQDDELRLALRKKAIERSNCFSWNKCAEETYSALVEW